MSYKLRTELSEDYENEVIIRGKMMDDEMLALQKAIIGLLGRRAEISVTLAGNEYFLPLDKLLFFETDGEKTAVHTADRMYHSDKRLWQLEESLPVNFIRVSKSCILNVSRVSSIAKNITGASTVTFFSCDKKAYVSRSYYKLLRDRIEQIRL